MRPRPPPPATARLPSTRARARACDGPPAWRPPGAAAPRSRRCGAWCSSVLAPPRWRLGADLLERARVRIAVVSPAHERRRVTEPPALHAFVRHLAHEHRVEGHPRALPPTRPSALPTGGARLAAEPGAADERREYLEQLPPLGRFERRRVPDVMEVAVGVVETEQQRPDAVAALRQSVAADHAIRRAPMLHLDPSAHTGLVRLVVA